MQLKRKGLRVTTPPCVCKFGSYIAADGVPWFDYEEVLALFEEVPKRASMVVSTDDVEGVEIQLHGKGLENLMWTTTESPKYKRQTSFYPAMRQLMKRFAKAGHTKVYMTLYSH